MVRSKCSIALDTVWAYHQLLCSWLPSTLWFTWAAAITARAWATQSQPISSVGRSPQSQRDLTDELCGLQSTCAGMWEGARTRPQRQREQLPSFLWKYCRLRLTQASLKSTLGLSLLQAQTWVLLRMVFSIKAASIISQHYAPGRGNENQLLSGSHIGEQLTFPVI